MRSNFKAELMYYEGNDKFPKLFEKNEFSSIHFFGVAENEKQLNYRNMDERVEKISYFKKILDFTNNIEIKPWDMKPGMLIDYVSEFGNEEEKIIALVVSIKPFFCFDRSKGKFCNICGKNIEHYFIKCSKVNSQKNIYLVFSP